MIKVKCVSAGNSDLVKNKMYTLLSTEIIDGNEFYKIQEIRNGDNLFYDWRFEELPGTLNVNIRIL